MFRFIHVADIHLDSPLRKLEQYEGAPVEALRGATRRALENLVDLAVSQSTDFILIAGDLYDGDWQDYNTGLFFISRLAELRKTGIKVFLVTGNHDAASRMTKSLRLPENVHIFPTDHPATFTMEKLRVAVHGQGFSTPAVKRNIAKDYPKALSGYFNIGMLHTCATGRKGHEAYAPCDISDLISKGYDYWALGHVHQRETLSAEPPILFSGNIQGRHVRESGPKGCVLVQVDGNGRCAPQFFPLDVIRWARASVDISQAADPYEVIDQVCDHLTVLWEENGGIPLAVRIELTGSCRIHEELSSAPDHWINEIRSAALDLGQGDIWLEKVKFLARPRQEDNSKSIAHGPLGEMLSFFDEVAADPEQLESIVAPLRKLEKKLPRALREDGETLCLHDLQWLVENLAKARSMLYKRLIATDGKR
jgi:exonuclease SbcD